MVEKTKITVLFSVLMVLVAIVSYPEKAQWSSMLASSSLFNKSSIYGDAII